MRITLVLLLLHCFFETLPAQTPYTVVAVSGLKLRATPGQQGKVLALAPFGAQVSVANMEMNGDGMPFVKNARRDSVGVLNTVHFWNGEAMEIMNQPHIGYWWPVQYQGKTGYMFSGFLAGSEELQTRYDQVNDEWRVFRPGGTACAAAYPDLKNEYHWYGLFRQADGKYNLRAVRLQYKVGDYTEEDGSFDLIYRELLIHTDAEEQPLFVVGRKGKLSERRNIAGEEAYPVPGKPSIFLSGPDLHPDSALLHSYGVHIEKSLYQYFVSLDNGSTRQKLFWQKSERHTPLSPSELLWTGDLDGDGRRDYLFDADGEEGGNMLYLSSQAGPGELAGLVAVMWHWYCC